jgi:UDP-glucose 4-epimerase
MANKMKIILTGGAGFVGTNVATKLIADGHSLIIIDNLKTGYSKNISEKATFIHMDCSDEDLINKITEPFDVMIHIAGQASKEKSFQEVFYDLNSNQKSTLVLLELCKKMKCKRFIFISTVCIYGGISNHGIFKEESPPVFDTFYALHKYSSEHYCRFYYEQEQINYTIFRLFTCYGPHQDLSDTKKGMVSIFLNQFLQKSTNDVIVKGSLERYRDFVYVEDVASIIAMSLDKIETYNEIINLGSSRKTTIRELLETINIEGHFEKKIVELPGIIGDMLGCYADTTKLSTIFPNFQFTDLKEGLKNMILHARRV